MNDEHPSYRAAARMIGFFLFPQFQLLDMSGPLAAFQMANFVAGTVLYEPVCVSRDGGPVPTTAGLDVSSVRAELGHRSLDTLVVVGGAGVHEVDDSVLNAVRMLAGGARRIASVCTGAFMLAAAGLLDGRRATTHWRHAARLQRLFPAVRIEVDRI